MPIELPNNENVDEIVLPNGANASEVYGPNGNLVWEAVDIPDSATDYSEYTTDATPDDWSEWGSGATWTVRDGGSDYVGETYLEYEETSGSRTGLLWSGEGTLEDVEIAWSAICPNPGNTDLMNGVIRASGSDPDTGSGYIATIGDESTGEVLIQKIVDGNLTSPIASGETVTNWDPNEWVNWRFQAFGNEVKVRVWMASDGEPNDWLLEVTDSDVTGAGEFGVYQFRESTTNPTEWDWFSYSNTSEDAYIFDDGSGNENSDVAIEDQLYTTSYDANSYALGGK